MGERKTFLTQQGLQKAEEELEYLCTVRREQVAHRLHEAMEGGDVQENAEYEDARNERSFVEGRILTLENLLKNAVIIEDHGPTDRVGLGSKVTVVEINGQESNTEPETYHVVGSAEADPVTGYISNESPLGRGLMGSMVDDVVQVKAPAGILKFKVLQID
jgi:transcription elongation factor GreA